MKIKDNMYVPCLALTTPEFYSQRMMFDTGYVFKELKSARVICNNGIMYHDKTTNSNRWIEAGGRISSARRYK